MLGIKYHIAGNKAQTSFGTPQFLCAGLAVAGKGSAAGLGAPCWGSSQFQGGGELAFFQLHSIQSHFFSCSNSSHDLQKQETYGPLLLQLPIQRIHNVICNKQQLYRSMVLIRSSDLCVTLNGRLPRVLVPSSQGLFQCPTAVGLAMGFQLSPVPRVALWGCCYWGPPYWH